MISVTSKPKELGTYAIHTKDKLLFEHDAANIPKLGADVGTLNNKTKELQKIGKIIDIIGPVKNPLIVVKLQKRIEDQNVFSKDIEFYRNKEFPDERKRKMKKKCLQRPIEREKTSKDRKNTHKFTDKGKKSTINKEKKRKNN